MINRLSAEQVEAELNNIERCGVSSELREHIAALEADLIEASDELRKAADLLDVRVKDERDKFRAENAALKVLIEELKNDNKDIYAVNFNINRISAENASLRAALEKIGIEDSANSNFNRSEDECSYYINTAKMPSPPPPTKD